MIYHYKTIPLKKAIPYLSPFINSIHDYCVEVYQNEAYGQSLRDKFDQVTSGKIKGQMVFDGDAPKGFFWIEIINREYGTCMFHCLDNEWEETLVDAFFCSGFSQGNLFEIFLFSDTSDILSYLAGRGAIENYRQRMAVFLQETDFSVFETEFQIVPLSTIDVSAIVQLSIAAHLVSQDYLGYKGLVDNTQRTFLEQDVRANIFGSFNDKVSLALVDGSGRLVGFCCYVDVEMWGEKRVPWLFDMCVHPDFHSLGYGKGLLTHSLAMLQQEGLKYAGLAVTNSNGSALGLYQHIGFTFVENFYEYFF